MKRGKHICNTLKQIRLDIAQANGIDYHPTPCNHDGDCAGTCPGCESEVQYLEKEIERHRSLGKAVMLAGVSLGMTGLSAMAAGNTTTPTENAAQSQVCDTTIRDVVFGRSPEAMPSFPGGDAALLKFIQDNLEYPAEAIKNKIEGRVIVQFIVNETGEVSDIKVVRSVNEALDQECIRICQLLPKFSPGRRNGEAVKVWYTLPITFKLPIEDPE